MAGRCGTNPSILSTKNKNNCNEKGHCKKEGRNETEKDSFNDWRISCHD